MGQQYRSRAVKDNPRNAEGIVSTGNSGDQPQSFFGSNPDLVGWHDISDQVASDDGMSERDVKTPNHALPMPLA